MAGQRYSRDCARRLVVITPGRRKICDGGHEYCPGLPGNAAASAAIMSLPRRTHAGQGRSVGGVAGRGTRLTAPSGHEARQRPHP